MGRRSAACGEDIIFAGTNRTTNNNDLVQNQNSVTFDNTAGSFTLQGNTLFLLAGGMTNNSTNTQTLDFTLNVGGWTGVALDDSQPGTPLPAVFWCNQMFSRLLSETWGLLS